MCLIGERKDECKYQQNREKEKKGEYFNISEKKWLDVLIEDSKFLKKKEMCHLSWTN